MGSAANKEKSCGAVVFTRDKGGIGYVLVRQRSGNYSFPKGHVEAGETEEQTALREIWEETGLRPVILPGFRDGETYEIAKKPGTVKDVVYFIAEYSGQPFHPMDTDAVTVELFSCEEALDMLPTESRRNVLMHADAYLKQLQELNSRMLIRTASMEDLDAVTEVEAECFPPAEAASREEFSERLEAYGDHFLLMFDGDRLVSFVDGFVTDEPDLTDEMYADAGLHDENGRWQMIFGVNTIPSYRGKGCAGELIRRMIAEANAQGRMGMVLTCKDELVPYYAKFGFVSEGTSEKSVHGGVSWNQMRLTFDPAQQPFRDKK